MAREMLLNSGALALYVSSLRVHQQHFNSTIKRKRVNKLKTAAIIILHFAFFLNKNHLKEKLDEYIKLWNGLVKVFRNERREGLIQARSIGAQKAKLGQVGSMR